jgi:hypothetical protein
MNISDLKNLKIPDLSKIDVKDIDVNKIKDQLIENKEVVIQVAIGVIAFFMIVSMWNGSQHEIKKYKKDIISMQSKEGIITEYKAAQSAIDTFLNNLPAALSEAQMINVITDMADKNKVKILTFVPNTSLEGREHYRETSIQFSMQSKDYKSMVRLIADIERAKTILQIKQCFIMNEVTQKEQEGEILDDRLLTFRIDVASLEVKKE